MSDLNQNSCNHVLKNLENPNNHLAIEVDVTEKESILNAVEKMTKQFGRPPDIIVNSAGIINKGQVFSKGIKITTKIHIRKFEEQSGVLLGFISDIHRVLSVSADPVDVRNQPQQSTRPQII